MRNISCIITLLFAICISTQAQRPRLTKDEFRTKQEEFITKKAGLTQKEAAKFFPLYFELQEKKRECNKKAWQQIRRAKENKLSEKEYSEVVEDIIKARIESDKLDLEYLYKYKEFLSPKKIFELQDAEMMFHRELLKPHRRP